MALVKCPDCGQEVSDKAAVCPRCAAPIKSCRPDGEVKIKLSFKGLDGKSTAQHLKCSITDNDTGEDLWNGIAGEIASFKVKKRTEVTIKYKNNGLYKYEGLVADVEANKRYQVICKGISSGCLTAFLSGITLGLVKSTISFSLSEVDVIDSD